MFSFTVSTGVVSGVPEAVGVVVSGAGVLAVPPPQPARTPPSMATVRSMARNFFTFIPPMIWCM